MVGGVRWPKKRDSAARSSYDERPRRGRTEKGHRQANGEAGAESAGKRERDGVAKERRAAGTKAGKSGGSPHRKMPTGHEVARTGNHRRGQRYDQGKGTKK